MTSQEIFSGERFFPELDLPIHWLLLAGADSGFTPEVQQELARASESWIWDADPVGYHPAAKISTATAFYGNAFNSPAEIYANAQQVMAKAGFTGEVPYQAEITGFPRLRQVPAGLTNEAYRLSEKVVARELITQALQQQGLTARDVDLFLVATSIPIHSRFHLEWAAAADIAHTVPVYRFCMACNSSGRALAEVFSGSFDAILSQKKSYRDGEPAVVVLFSLDDGQRLALQPSDPLTPQYFSTGAGAVALRYHHQSEGSLRLLAHHSMAWEYGTQYLRAPRPYDYWPASECEGLYTAQFLKTPDNGRTIDMHPRAGAAFIMGAEKVAEAALEKYEAAGFHRSRIKRVVVHHPSFPVFNGLKDRLLKKGFTDDQLHWVIHEGNVPVATILMALNRQLGEFEVGDHVMVLSFGAGGEYTCFVAEMGAAEY